MALEGFLHESVLLLGAAVVVLLVSHRLRVPSVVGMLSTGLLIGPSGLGWIAEGERVELFAEVGVVMLLFAIGLELSLERLQELRRALLVGGAAQAALSAVVTAAIALAAGMELRAAVFLGLVVTLSSTAIVLKLYADRRETDTPSGKIVLAILLFQDFLVVPMIVLTPVLAGAVEASATVLALRFGGALAAIALVFVVARVGMPLLFRQLAVTRSREVFVLGALAVCLAGAWLTHSLGFSLALGAFLAGIVVSETDYSHQVVADMAPFRDVFSSVFFVSIGMLVDLSYAAAHLPALAGLAVGIVIVKALAAGAATALLRVPARVVILVGLGLAQIGEFSFVLMEVGRENGLLAGGGYQLVLAAAVLTMLATPLLVAAAPRVAEAWLRRRPQRVADVEATAGLSGHVVVVGFGVNGRLLVRVLREAGVRYVVIELDGEQVRQALRAGERILYGDSTRREILEHAGIARAQIVVFAISDLAAVRRSIRLARELHPGIEIIVRTRMMRHVEELRGCGADQVIAEEFETAIEIFTRVLEGYHVPRNVIRAQTRALRGESYAMLRTEAIGKGVSAAVLEALTAGTTDVFLAGAGSAVAGRTLKELDLRRRSGASVIAVVRGETPYPNPSADLVIEPGDNLVLVGSHAEIDRAFDCLAAAPDDGS